MVRPNGHRQCSNCNGRVNQSAVAEDWLAAKDREDFRHDSEERQGDDVNLWVTEEPEQVLPQHGSTVLRVEDVSAELAICTKGKQSCGKRREAHDDKDRGHQGVPSKDRHAPHGHTRSAHGDDGGDEVHTTQNGSKSRQR